jgi:SsrA-binding protein
MSLLAKNKRAHFDHTILETLEAGIILRWFEVKALKTHKANLSDAFIKIDAREVRLINCDIPLYKKTDIRLVPWYEPKGKRKLLITANQRTRLRERTHKTGYRLIPLEIYEDSRHFIKVKIALAQITRKIDKRTKIREKDEKKLMKQIRIG